MAYYAYRYPGLYKFRDLLDEYFKGSRFEGRFVCKIPGSGGPYIAVYEEGSSEYILAMIYISTKTRRYNVYWTDRSKEPNSSEKEELFYVVHNLFEANKESL